MAKTLYLIRGLPGSGKSTLGEILCPGRCFAADDFFVKDGVYNFDPVLLPAAHQECQRLAREALMDGSGANVAISNTFTQKWEMKAYLEMAVYLGANVFVISCENSFGNVHGVPEETIDRMSGRWHNYYGKE